MKLLSIALALAAFHTGDASTGFSSVEHLETTTIAMASASNSDASMGYFAGSDGGAGGFVAYDGSDGSLSFTTVAQAGVIPMGIATDGKDTMVLGGLFGAGASTDGGDSFTSITQGQGFKLLATQDAKYNEGPGMFSFAGSFFAPQAIDGIATSTDGQTWDLKTTTAFYQPALTRYGAIPDADTIYLTAGSWNTTDDEEVTAKAPRPITRALRTTKDGKVSYKPGLLGKAKAEDGDDTATDDDKGFWGQVAKSTDGGETWEIVYETIDAGYYLNDIHCVDANTCMFTMEGNYQPKVMGTTDGGANWSELLVDPSSDSLMTIRMLGSDEAWAVGGGDTGRAWHTTDGGDNWEQLTTDLTDAASLVSFDLRNDEGIMYMTGILRSQLCSVLKAEI